MLRGQLFSDAPVSLYSLSVRLAKAYWVNRNDCDTFAMCVDQSQKGVYSRILWKKMQHQVSLQDFYQGILSTYGDGSSYN